MLRPDLKDEPYCSNCGYQLTGAVESAKCPECGKPLVEVLTRNTQLSGTGRRYRSKARLFGLPVIDIALGAKGAETYGQARGIIAIGDLATGFLALGGLACGIVAIGGGAAGLCTALGGGAVGGLATGGAAVGVMANGGGSLGVVAQGADAAGVFTRSARTRAGGYPPIFDQLSWFFGQSPGAGGVVHSVLVILGLTLFAAAIIGLIAVRALRRQEELLDDRGITPKPRV